MNEDVRAIIQGTLDHLRAHICRCCGKKARGANMRDPETECACEIYDIHELGNATASGEGRYRSGCGKCPDHCRCPGDVDADGYWRYDADR